MKTVIAATDFSPSSLNACKYAAMLAMKLKSKLIVLNLFDVPMVHSNSGLFFMSFQTTRKEQGEQLRKFESEIVKAFPKVKLESIVTTGSLQQEIQNYVHSHQIAAVVMGLGTKTKLNRFIYGSHSTDIAGKIDAPVIIVPEKYNKHQIKSILLGVDNNEKLYHAKLEGFERFVLETKVRLKLVHIRTKDELFHPTQLEIILNHKKHKIVSINAKSAQSGIVTHANHFSFDMIAIVSKKHSVFYEMFSETHTKQIAFASNIPVMSIHE